MSERRTDFELLRDFARFGDQQAFASAVRRHLDLVYGTAVRKVGDHGGAEEITQNVFTALARKAWQFAPDDSLPAWLHRTTLLEAKAWLRGELRRRRREQIASELGTTMKGPNEQPALSVLVPLIDEALLSVHEKDRAALLLRYYESQSLREVGASLGVSEDAAQKRVASGLEKLARFFQRQGFKTATGSVVAAALQNTATSAPAIVAASVAQTAAQLAPPTMMGIATIVSRFASLTQAQIATLCLTIISVPVGRQWNEAHAVQKEATVMQAKLDITRADQEKLSVATEGLRAESVQLNSALTEAAKLQRDNQEALRKWETLGDRIRRLLRDANYRWQDDLPYIRIPKSLLKEFDLQHGAFEHLQGGFERSGRISELALELLGITPGERDATEQVLANYWTEVEGLMAAHGYEIDTVIWQSGRLNKSVIVPPLGNWLKSLADEARVQISQPLGEQREKLLFGGWDEGAIQIFSPGNFWKISEEPQKFTVWFEPASGGDGPEWRLFKPLIF